MLSFGFPPISSPSARVLILGSLPGQLSLELGEYYASQQNVFWQIVATRVGELPQDYSGRVAALIEHRVAVWDVLAAATRPGSLDTSIEKGAVPNNFRPFFNAHPNVCLIGFNGATAAKLYDRLVMPTLTDTQRAIAKQTLPSTSGVHARMTFAEKVARWSLLWDDFAVKATATDELAPQ
jgi:TDG/mug DNA glycosylase family protein